jgi:hypothetical protein
MYNRTIWTKGIKNLNLFKLKCMAASTIDKELIRYFTLLDQKQKETLLAMIKSFLKPTSSTTERISIEQYNKELDEANERIENGEFVTMEELLKEIKTW